MGAETAIDRAIRRAQRNLVPGGLDSLWSHAFIFQGNRIDDRAWVLESDIDPSGGYLRFGVQENRIEKYADEKVYVNLAVLDFDLTEDQAKRVVAAGLDFVSKGTRYAIGGLLKTYWAILREGLGEEKRKDSTFCSSFVRALYRHVGIDLVPKVAVRHTAPEHLFQTPVRHARHELIRKKE